jgi:protein-S-isoprenylcysteine O-methyltransferase Ste14
MAAYTIAICWMVFFAYWIGNFRAVKATAEPQSFFTGLKHRAPVVLGVIVIFTSRSNPLLKPLLFTPGALSDVLAAAICILGLLFAIWARRTLARNWSSEVVFKEGHELIERGPYQFVRHPIYTGILIMILGTLIAEPHRGALVGFLLIAAGFYIKLRLEEALLLRHFGEQYTDYKSRVKALVPFVL